MNHICFDKHSMKLKGSFNLDLESAQMGPESSWAGVYHVTCLLNSHFTIACIWGIHFRNTFEIILAAISWYKILKLVSCDMFACQPFHNRLHWKIILPPIYWSKCLRYWSQRTRRMMAFHFYFPFASFFFPACPLFKQVIFHPLSATWFKIIWDLLFRIRDLRLRIQNLWFKIADSRLRMSAFHKLSAKLLSGQMVNMGRWKFAWYGRRDQGDIHSLFFHLRYQGRVMLIENTASLWGTTTRWHSRHKIVVCFSQPILIIRRFWYTLLILHLQ